MVFSTEDKAIIKHYVEKGFSSYKIWKENPEKKWVLSSVKRLVKRFRKNGTMERQKRSGRPKSARTPENEAAVEEMICSQEEDPGTHVTPRNIAKELKISHSSVCRIVRASR